MEFGLLLVFAFLSHVETNQIYLLLGLFQMAFDQLVFQRFLLEDLLLEFLQFLLVALLL
jgi:hypothetical protein